MKWDRTGRQVQLCKERKCATRQQRRLFFSGRGVECMTSMGSENRRKQPSNTRTSSETTIAAGWPDINLTSEADCWFRTYIALGYSKYHLQRAAPLTYDFRSSGWVAYIIILNYKVPNNNKVLGGLGLKTLEHALLIICHKHIVAYSR